MAKRATEVPPWVSLDAASGAPPHRQLYEGIRAGILSGRLPAGARLPSPRTLAAELGVSRTTVVAAFQQLLAEGYLEGRTGSGTYVADDLPDGLLGVGPVGRRGPRISPSWRGLSRRGTLLAATLTSVARDRGAARAFRPGVPAPGGFPFGVWRRLAGKVWRRPSPGSPASRRRTSTRSGPR